MKKAKKRPARWRMMKEGEIIHKGDEFLYSFFANTKPGWYPFYESIGKPTSPMLALAKAARTRRKLPPAFRNRVKATY